MVKIKKLIVFLIACVIAIASGYIYLFDKYHSGQAAFSQDKNTDLTTREIYVTIEQSQKWTGEDKITVGGQYDGKIYNNTGIDYTDWTVVIENLPKGSYIDSSWDGVYVEEEGKITITPLEYNVDILHDTVRPFGMILYTPYQCKLTDITVYASTKTVMTADPVFWVVQSITALAVIVSIIVIVYDRRVKRLRRKRDEYREIIEQSLRTFANIIDAKDRYTSGHSERVAIYSREIAKRMELSADECERIYYIAFLHDIGKIAIPDSILKKAGALTDEERKVIQTHPSVGGDILKDFTSIEGISEGARYHHEKYDGTGYTEGRKGEDIPLLARIICVADSYDAMASKRCYRSDLPEDYILSELEKCSGTQFDPEIAKVMIGMIHDGYVETVKETVDKEKADDVPIEIA